MATSITPNARQAAAELITDLTALPRTALADDRVAAAVLGMQPETLGNWRCTGRYNLPYVKVGRNVRYRVGDLLDFLERRTRTHTGQSSRPATAA